MKINEIGRSMVEMLGVLAIIGILSATGLYGYHKAMIKHKTNKKHLQKKMLFILPCHCLSKTTNTLSSYTFSTED